VTFRVVLQRLAAAELQDDYDDAARHSPLDADRWLDRFLLALKSLEERPERCSPVREHKKVGVELREFLFGKRPWVFRVAFVADGDTARILRVRRAQRRPLSADDLREALSDEFRMTSKTHAAGRIRPSSKTEAWGLRGR
jgi:plasmid stabilization system protein ParE